MTRVTRSKTLYMKKSQGLKSQHKNNLKNPKQKQ